MIGWRAAASRGQGGLVHSGNRSAHDVGAACIRVVCRSWFATRCTGVSVIHITAVGVAVVTILPMLVGSGRTKRFLLTATCTAKSHGWFLWKPSTAALTATVAFVAIVERVLLLRGAIDAAWGLLADGHAELLNVCKPALHCDQAVGLALHCFMAYVEPSLQVSCRTTQATRCRPQRPYCIHVAKAGATLVDECNCVGPTFLEGVDHLDNWQDCILT